LGHDFVYGDKFALNILIDLNAVPCYSLLLVEKGKNLIMYSTPEAFKSLQNGAKEDKAVTLSFTLNIRQKPFSMRSHGQ
jgi:hypothetical protein